MFALPIQQIKGYHLFCSATLFSAKNETRHDKTNQIAEHGTKPFTRVALWLLLIWLRCLLSVFRSSFLSSLIQLNPRLFKENYDIGKYHIGSLINFLQQKEKIP